MSAPIPPSMKKSLLLAPYLSITHTYGRCGDISEENQAVPL